MVRGQSRTSELEKLLAEFSEQEQMAVEDLKEKSKVVMRLEVEVAELKKNETLSKKKAIENFKSSDDFQEVVVTLASSYFGEDFDFCKRQLAYHYPNLDIDLDSMKMDRDQI